MLGGVRMEVEGVPQLVGSAPWGTDTRSANSLCLPLQLVAVGGGCPPGQPAGSGSGSTVGPFAIRSAKEQVDCELLP